VSRPRAADDYATIRARMEELRHQREGGAGDPADMTAASDAERHRREFIEGFPPPWVPTIFVKNPRP
jgi:hypothetical protein